MRIRSAWTAFAVCCVLGTASAQCVGSWANGFGAPGADGKISRLAAYDGGPAPVLYAAGQFLAIGDVTANRVARWDGLSWAPLGSGLTGTCASSYPPGACDITAMVAAQEASGPVLYVAGTFTAAGGVPTPSGMARWNGSSWSAVPPGIGPPAALAVYDDGTGPHLYAGGNYSPSGVMKLIGGSWAQVPGAPGIAISNVHALAVIDLGSGPRLYAAGQCSGPAFGISGFFGRWNGSTWAGTAVSGSVNVITSVSGPSGVSVYVAGGFWSVGGIPAMNVACVIGPSPGALGAGIGGNVEALASFDDGTGPALYATGFFSGGGTPVSGSQIARWDGTQWTPLGGGLSGCGIVDGHTLATLGTGAGSSLFVGGEFMAAGSTPATGIARWDGNAWHSVTGAPTQGTGRQTFALKRAALPSGESLFAAGQMCFAGSAVVSGVARYDATGWHSLGSAIGGFVNALETYDEGGGLALFAGGSLTGAFANDALARWDGVSWSAVGGGLALVGSSGSPSVSCLLAHDDGSGPSLFAGGFFNQAGGLPVSNIARWNGSSWSALAGGVSGTASPSFTPGPSTLAVFDDGTGAALYAAGTFSSAGGQAAQELAKWNGASWTPIPTGLPTYYPSIDSMAAFDDGNGSALYVSGDFSVIGGVTAPGFARWNGQAWTAESLPPTNSAASITGVRRLAVLDDGAGPALYAVVIAGPPTSRTIRRWNGTAWTQIGLEFVDSDPGTTLGPRAYATFDDGSGPALFTGGGFRFVGGSPSFGFAKWVTPRPTLTLSQPGGAGSGVLIANAYLTPGHEYFNIFSTTPCPGPPGSGPYLGLCAPDPTALLAQFNLPFTTPPFHIFAFTPSVTFGPFPAPSGLTVDAICFDCCGPIGCISPASRFMIQ